MVCATFRSILIVIFFKTVIVRRKGFHLLKGQKDFTEWRASAGASHCFQQRFQSIYDRTMMFFFSFALPWHLFHIIEEKECSRIRKTKSSG